MTLKIYFRTIFYLIQYRLSGLALLLNDLLFSNFLHRLFVGQKKPGVVG